MAGAFTHMAIANQAISSFDISDPLGKILRKYKSFLTLGCVSPDIPYLSHLVDPKLSNWADLMHYNNTNGIVKNAIHSLSAAKIKNEDWESQLAWLLGFVSHLVADATIHPIIESLVGPYTDPDVRTNHRISEMTQDVMIFKEVMNLEVTAAEFTNLLRASSYSSSYDKVIEFWKNHAEVNYPFSGKFPADSVVSSYKDELDTAEGGNALARLFRHLGLNFAYRTYDDLINNSMDLVTKYYKEIQLPNRLKGKFKDDGFQYAVNNLVNVWSKIERSLFTNDNVVQFIPNWDLDTGIDQETGIRTYWS